MSNLTKSIGFGYTLDISSVTIVARGAESQLRSLRMINGALPATDGGMPEVRLFANRANFLAVEAVAAPVSVSAAYRQAREEALRASSVAMAAVGDRLRNLAGLGQPHGLLPHQWQFAAHAFCRRGVLNASEQGTGKTRTAWLLTHLWQDRRILIVCPKSLIAQWQEEWHAMWQKAPPLTLLPLGDGEVRKRQELLFDLVRQKDYMGPTAVIVNYEVLATLQKTLLAWSPNMIIYDEAARLKTPTARVTKAALALTDDLHERGGHVMLCTGTPVGNHVGDLYTLARMADPSLVPGGKKGYSTFLHRYAEMVLKPIAGFQKWCPVGCIDPAGLMQTLAPIWFRATKAACLELPPKQYRTVRVSLPRETLALYKKVKADGPSALGAPLSLDGELTNMVYLQRITGGFQPIPDNEHGSVWGREPLPCPKVAWLQEWARDTLLENPTARAIIWCRFNAEVWRLCHVLGALLGADRVQVANGDIKETQLERAKAEFNSRSEEGVQVIVAQWQKLSHGHNLQACDTNIFFSHTWSYIERAQAEDRSHRMGRADAVQYIDLVAVDPAKTKRVETIDEQIIAAMRDKRDLAAQLVRETIVG